MTNEDYFNIVLKQIHNYYTVTLWLIGTHKPQGFVLFLKMGSQVYKINGNVYITAVLSSHYQLFLMVLGWAKKSG
jgi:hypothetical protein